MDEGHDSKSCKPVMNRLGGSIPSHPANACYCCNMEVVRLDEGPILKIGKSVTNRLGGVRIPLLPP